MKQRWLVSLAGLMIVGGCAPVHSTPPVLPMNFVVSAPPDSALRLVRAALRAEHLPVDGDSAASYFRTLSSTFRVRPGGLGEATIVLRFRATADSPDGQTARVAFEATAQEHPRALSVGVGDNRDPRRSGPHEINPNDREVHQRLARLLDRLATLGLHGAASSPQGRGAA
jgi:hypothetical protein